MLLCRDCEHCSPHPHANDPYDLARCERLTIPNLVSGGERAAFCKDERSALGRCGADGKFFLAVLADEPTTATVGA